MNVTDNKSGLPTAATLYSGLGGLDLGLHGAGYQLLWQAEINRACRTILARHWPGLPRYGDVRDIVGASVPVPDLLAGGFPCTDISSARLAPQGIEGAKSGLWLEFARLIGEIRPRFVLVENAPGLLRRGFDRVLGDLAALGYDAEWSCLSARSLGAPHSRRRVFILAYPHGHGPQGGSVLLRAQRAAAACDSAAQRTYWHRVPQPRTLGVASRPPDWMERLQAIGNAIAPGVAELIGRALLPELGA